MGVTNAFVFVFQRLHKGNYNKEAITQLGRNQGSVKRKSQLDEEDETIVTSVIGVTGTASSSKGLKKYDSRGIKQQTFNKHVLDFIALDGVPFSVTEGRGFRQLVQSVDNQLTCPSKSSICRLLINKHAQVILEIMIVLILVNF